MTPTAAEQIIIFHKCIVDPIYFIENYVHVYNPLKGTILFELYDFQKEMLVNYQQNRHNIVMSPRHTGKTDVTWAFLLWVSIFNTYKTTLIVSDKHDSAKEIIDRIRKSFDLLPDWMKPDLMESNKMCVTFDNGSRIISHATTAAAARGLALSYLYWDNMAFVKPTIQQDFWTSVYPCLATGGSAILTSSPNGTSELFHKTWNEAEDGTNNFFSKRVHWGEMPGYTTTLKGGLSEKTWRQEYECEFIT